MVEKVGRVSNPLTIIAIFAGIAEISGVVVLPLLSEQNQSVFIWYVMFFPVLLVVMFFSTLLYKHKVLYSPGDFRNDSNFVLMASKEGQRVLQKSESTSSKFKMFTEELPFK